MLRSYCAATGPIEGEIKARTDMRFLMENADAVKLAIDLYLNQVKIEWPLGWPPYRASAKGDYRPQAFSALRRHP
jgi:hypothetical protein